MLQNAALQDFRGYIKKRLSYAQYRVGTVWYRAEIKDNSILSNGIVRVKIKEKILDMMKYGNRALQHFPWRESG